MIEVSLEVLRMHPYLRKTIALFLPMTGILLIEAIWSLNPSQMRLPSLFVDFNFYNSQKKTYDFNGQGPWQNESSQHKLL